MDDQLKSKIARFIRQAVFNEQSEPLTGLDLFHCPASPSKPNKVWGKQWEGGANTDSIEPITETVCQIAVDDASGLDGVQRYQLIPYHDGKASGRLVFRQQGYTDMGFDSEGSSQAGLIAQQMRHNEVLMKTSTMAMGGIIQTQQRMLDRVMSHNEKLIGQRIEGFELLEEARSQKHERELEMLGEARKQEMQDQLMDKANLLLPTVVNRLTKTNLLPETTTPQAEMLKQIVHSLEPHQLEALQGILKVEQLMPLMELIKSYQDEEKEQSSVNN